MEGVEKLRFDTEGILAPLENTGRRFFVACGLLLAVIAWGGYAYAQQLIHGLSVTGLNRPVNWGTYIGNFVFFVSISLAGTLISAILRLIHAEWRRPITRCAEVITVLSLLFAVVNIGTDMGRPDRLLNCILHGQFRSPIMWDVLSINSYLAASILYLYLPLIPDMAILRDRPTGRWRWLYRILAIGYCGTEKQHKWLERIVSVMAILIIPIGISVHTVTAWLFATTVQPVWHSTIYGPFFVVGALYTGTAVLVIIMALLRWGLGLKSILKDVHFNNLGLVLMAEGLLVAYFLLCMYLVEITGAEPHIMKVVMSEIKGAFAVPFWLMILVGILFPPLFLSMRRARTVGGCVFAAAIVVAAMWIERFLIVVPTLTQPRLPWREGVYAPSWVEWSITAACLAAFALLYMLFTKVFPIISLWEMQEGIEHGMSKVRRRHEGYLPERLEKEKS
ncbi:MAG: polysulfide reductase NrfD [Planctomycetes bacterium]|nr:polysulfide reductase NrfD [Planctomycetota bacterium]